MSYTFYTAAFLCIAAMCANALGITDLGHGGKIAAGFIAVISGYAASYFTALCAAPKKRYSIIKSTVIFIFVFYIIVLVDFTLIDDNLGRNIFNIYNWNTTAFSDYINRNTNIVPFATVRLFINAVKNSALPLYAVLENLLGNLLAFMPLPFFLASLFKRFNNWYSVFIAVLLSVITVELLQLLFLTGSSDIDDVILNTAGAMLLYGVLRIKGVSRFISKITFGVWETENGTD
mgnify:FL=1